MKIRMVSSNMVRKNVDDDDDGMKRKVCGCSATTILIVPILYLLERTRLLGSRATLLGIHRSNLAYPFC
jgi:hypothetical protein